MKPELTAQILGMYLDRDCDVINADGESQFSGVISYSGLSYWYLNFYKVRPHLRRLESITEEECREVFKLVYGTPWDNGENCLKDWFLEVFNAFNFGKHLAIGTPSAWLYLLSKGFDLFGLIDAGLAKEVSE